jgi:hypothetical protein
LSEGKIADAEGVLRRALALRTARLGDGHPDVAVTLRELGALMRLTRHFAQSDSLLLESRRRTVERLGADHPDVRRIDEERRRIPAGRIAR